MAAAACAREDAGGPASRRSRPRSAKRIRRRRRRIYLDKYLSRRGVVSRFSAITRHVVHLGERECHSRRHHKLLEYSPSVAYRKGPPLILARWWCMLRRGRCINNAGTFEFLMDVMALSISWK